MKGKEVHITPNLPKDITKLMLAYNIANNWCEHNLVKT